MALSGSIKSNDGRNTYWLEIITSTSGNTVYATARLWSASHPGGYGYAAGSAFPLKIIIGGVTCIDGNYPLTSNTWVSYNTGDGRKSYADLASTSLATGGGTVNVYTEYTNNFSTHYWAMAKGQTLSVSENTYPETPGKPTVTVGYSNVGVTTATISGSVTNWGSYASAGSYNLTCSNGSSGQNTSRNLTGLTPDTEYTVTFSATNNYGKSSSESTKFRTLANPSITSVTTTPSRTTCSFTINVNYAQGDSFSSRTIQYGTTTSYGSSTTDTSIYNLTPNTKYYYKITINSTKGGTATYTGDFTTTHTVPSIGTITPTIGDNTCSFPTSGSGITYYDNTSYDHATIKYRVQGTSGWATLTTSASPALLSGLDIVTTYEYEYTITDNGGGVSNTVTGTFTTTGQSKARIKVNGTWKKGRVFFKKNGEWVVSKKIFTKKNGEWVETKN